MTLGVGMGKGAMSELLYYVNTVESMNNIKIKI